jgi:hypothetical protein
MACTADESFVLSWQALELFLAMRQEHLKGRLGSDESSFTGDSDGLSGQLANIATGIQDTIAQVAHHCSERSPASKPCGPSAPLPPPTPPPLLPFLPPPLFLLLPFGENLFCFVMNKFHHGMYLVSSLEA